MKHLEIVGRDYRELISAGTALESMAQDMQSSSCIALEDAQQSDGDQDNKSFFHKTAAWIKKVATAIAAKASSIIAKLYEAVLYLFNKVASKLSNAAQAVGKMLKTDKQKLNDFVKRLNNNLSEQRRLAFIAFAEDAYSGKNLKGLANAVANYESALLDGIKIVNTLSPGKMPASNVQRDISDIVARIQQMPEGVESFKTIHNSVITVEHLKAFNVDALVQGMQAWRKDGDNALKKVNKASKQLSDVSAALFEKLAASDKSDSVAEVVNNIARMHLSDLCYTNVNSLNGKNIPAIVRHVSNLTVIVTEMCDATELLD